MGLFCLVSLWVLLYIEQLDLQMSSGLPAFRLAHSYTAGSDWLLLWLRKRPEQADVLTHWMIRRTGETQAESGLICDGISHFMNAETGCSSECPALMLFLSMISSYLVFLTWFLLFWFVLQTFSYERKRDGEFSSIIIISTVFGFLLTNFC